MRYVDLSESIARPSKSTDRSHRCRDSRPPGPVESGNRSRRHSAIQMAVARPEFDSAASRAAKYLRLKNIDRRSANRNREASRSPAAAGAHARTLRTED